MHATEWFGRQKLTTRSESSIIYRQLFHDCRAGTNSPPMTLSFELFTAEGKNTPPKPLLWLWCTSTLHNHKTEQHQKWALPFCDYNYKIHFEQQITVCELYNSQTASNGHNTAFRAVIVFCDVISVKWTKKGGFDRHKHVPQKTNTKLTENEKEKEEKLAVKEGYFLWASSDRRTQGSITG